MNGYACSHSYCDVEENKTEVLMHGLLSQQIVGVSFRSRKKIPRGCRDESHFLIEPATKASC